MQLRQPFDPILKHLFRRKDATFIDSDEESRFRNYTIFCLTGVPLMISFGIYNLFVADYILALAVFLCCGALLTGVFLLYQGIASRSVYRVNALLFCLLLLYMTAIGGADGSKSLWSFTHPLIVFFLLGSREGALWTLFLFAGSQLALWNPYQLAWLHPYPTDFAIRFNISYLCVAIFTFFYERFRYTYRVRIEHQNELIQSELEEKRRVEEALRLSEEKYRAIYLQAAEGIFVIDTEGIILESNPKMNHMLGFGSNELVGRNIHDLIHPGDLANVPSQLPEILNGKTVMLERRMKTGDGGYRLFERSGRLIDENRILLLYRDIKDRKAAEEALEKANRELSKLANLDGLTQIANRRKFDITFKMEWQRLCREQQPLAIIIGDIDFFKQYNDLYGHQEGDNCLITIAQTLEHTLNRPADLVARFGGEEFIIILPNTPLVGAVQLAEEIRKRVALLRIPHKGSECSTYVTMSLGVSSMVPNHQCLPEDLIAAADKALYMAKQNGRNQSDSSDPHPLS